MNAEEQLRILGADFYHKGTKHLACITEFRLDSFTPYVVTCTCNLQIQYYSIADIEWILANLEDWRVTRNPKYWYVTATKVVK